MGEYKCSWIARSLKLNETKGFLYNQQDSDNCLVIQSSGSGEQTFLPEDGSRIFKGLNPCQSTYQYSL